MTIVVGNCGACGMPLIEPGGEKQQCKFGATSPSCPFSHSNVLDRIVDFEQRLFQLEERLKVSSMVNADRVAVLTDRIDHLLKHADDWKRSGRDG